MREPEDANGWPSAIAPPLTFNRSFSIFNSRWTDITCAANASLTYTKILVKLIINNKNFNKLKLKKKRNLNFFTFFKF